jgi:hypothetical protein
LGKFQRNFILVSPGVQPFGGGLSGRPLRLLPKYALANQHALGQHAVNYSALNQTNFL